MYPCRGSSCCEIFSFVDVRPPYKAVTFRLRVMGAVEKNYGKMQVNEAIREKDIRTPPPPPPLNPTPPPHPTPKKKQQQKIQQQRQRRRKTQRQSSKWKGRRNLDLSSGESKAGGERIASDWGPPRADRACQAHKTPPFNL